MNFDLMAILLKTFNLIKNNLLLIILLALFSFLFFYRMDWNTLVSWDEAWYGSISRHMLQTGEWMKMMWNGKPYYDHPPMGFWLMALSYKFFGINEFTTRLPSVLLSILAILFVYLTGKELFNKYIGFVAGLILGTCVWYFIRVRSGNLDAIFVFFYILTIYLSVKSSKNFRWFPLAMAAFGGLILSKTLVGFSAIFLIVFFDLRQIFKIKNVIWLIIGVGAGILVAYPWYYIHLRDYPLFFQDHFVNIGTRNKELSSYLQLNATLPLFYLHMGVRKWYYLWLLGLGLIIFTFRFIKKNYFFLIFWNFLILYPFLTTDKTQIWHLIPVYLPMALIIASGLYTGVDVFVNFLNRIVEYFLDKCHCERLKGAKQSRFRLLRHPDVKSGFLAMTKMMKSDLFKNLVFLIPLTIITLIQIKGFYKEVYPTSKFTPDDVDISKKVGKYSQNIFLDDDFLPIAVFYSGRNIQPLVTLSDEKKSMAKFFKTDEKNYVMITRNWAVANLDAENIPYKILEKNNSFSIVSR
jgi:4-amino-4-deoxy-L-arabinose transferase-like glycosyltransferase